MLVYFLVENAVSLASLKEYRSPQAQLIHLGVVIFMAGAWLACRRGVLSAHELRGIDAGIVFVGCCGTLLYVLLEEPFQAYTFLVPLIVFFALMLRSIFVPSSAPHTLWVSLATAGAAMGMAVALRADEPLSPLLPVSVMLVWSAVFSLSAAILATLASRLVFGLRQEVRKAFQVGQYTLEEKLGEGGMGVVYRARHALLRRRRQSSSCPWRRPAPTTCDASSARCSSPPSSATRTPSPCSTTGTPRTASSTTRWSTSTGSTCRCW
jgi:hypothetical protein